MTLRRLPGFLLFIPAVIMLSAVLAGPGMSTMSPGTWAGKRVALVIGNGAYKKVPNLANPTRDANAVAGMLKESGFGHVLLFRDLDVVRFKRTMREFQDVAQGAETAVIYYAGHGIQIEGENYLIPIDARLASEDDAQDETVSLDRMIRAIETVTHLKLVILDASRDNPFERTMRRRIAKRPGSDGLGKPPLGETLIAYAARAGSTADDRDGPNSPFTAALLKHLPVPGLDIRAAFGRVRDEVLEATGNKQEPFTYGSPLGGQPVALVPPQQQRQ